MKTIALSLVILAVSAAAAMAGSPDSLSDISSKAQIDVNAKAPAAGPALAAGDAPSPGLLAKIQLPRAAGREFNDIKKFARENESAHDGVTGDAVQTKKHGSLDVSKLSHNQAPTPAAIGKAVGNHANDGDEER